MVNHGAFIGVEIMSMTPSLQVQFGFIVSSGALIQGVIPGTGAAAAGLRQGDIIVKINDTPISSAPGRHERPLVASSPATSSRSQVVRGSQHLTVKVTLGRKVG